jgi:hypothetical protein
VMGYFLRLWMNGVVFEKYEMNCMKAISVEGRLGRWSK